MRDDNTIVLVPRHVMGYLDIQWADAMRRFMRFCERAAELDGDTETLHIVAKIGAEGIGEYAESVRSIAGVLSYARVFSNDEDKRETFRQISDHADDLYRRLADLQRWIQRFGIDVLLAKAAALEEGRAAA